MTQAIVGSWETLPPPGLTDTGRIHRFQNRTVARLQAAAETIAQQTFNQLLRTVQATYREGSGDLAASLQYRVEATRDGVNVEFTGGTNHIVYLTAVAGAPIASPGHFIPHVGRSRFYWRNPLYGKSPGMYTFMAQRPAFWRPRRGAGDVISDVLGAGAQLFTRTMINEHERALVEFVQNDLAPVTRSPRVNVQL